MGIKIIYVVLFLSILILGSIAGIDFTSLLVINLVMAIPFVIATRRRNNAYGKWRTKTIRDRTERRPSRPITDEDIDDYLELQEKEPYYDDESQEWKTPY